MTLSSDSVTVLGGALVVIVGVIFTFGYRFSDKSSKFDGKTQTDELNEIRMAMRSDSTVYAIDKLWAFLTETSDKIGQEGGNFDVTLLLFDTVYRESFNKLINEMERTFTESANIKQAWSGQKCLCWRLGKILYGCAIGLAGFGFPLLVLSSQSSPFPLSADSLILLWILFLAMSIAFIAPIKYTYDQIVSVAKIYREKRDKYLVDEVRISK